MMKKTIFLFLIFSKLVFAQETNDKIIYLDSLYKEVSIDNKFYTRVVKDYYLEKSEYRFLTFYKNNQLKEEKTLSGKDGGYVIGEKLEYFENGNKRSSILYENKIRHGKTFSWYEDGKLKKEGEFVSVKNATETEFKMIHYWNENGEKTISDGNGFVTLKNDYYEEIGYYKNGYKDGNWTGKSLKTTAHYEEVYSNGDFISGKSIADDGTEHEYTALEVKPEPIKGISHFYKHIANNFRQSDIAFKKNIHGKIIVEFVVEKDGSIVEVEIKKGLGYGLDEEAIRVVSSYDKWKPAYQRGRKVRCKFSIPISIQPSK
jgi:TonB family protein